MSPLPHFQAELLQFGHQVYLFAGIGKKTQDRLPHGTQGDRGPKEWSRGGPRVAPAGRDRGIDRPRSGEPEAPTSSRLARRRPRQLSAATQQRRILRGDTPAHRRLATARPRDSVGCGGVTTRPPRVSRLVLRGVRRPCHELEREEGACRSGGGSPRRCASAPPIARSARCPRGASRRVYEWSHTQTPRGAGDAPHALKAWRLTASARP